MSETGSIKFQCEHRVFDAVPEAVFEELDACRSRLFQRKLIGVYPNGIGYGNISVRACEPKQFYISGSATGGIEQLSPAHYSKVTNYNFDRNWLQCEGQIHASSESLTHAAIYESAPEANAVIHGHHMELWKSLLYKVPTTAQEIEYGTPEMACEVQRLFQETDVGEKGVIAMAGHEEGVFTFGQNLDEAFARLMSYLEQTDRPPCNTSSQQSKSNKSPAR